ncbi:MAG: hypothetical protein M3530_07860 [Thermoproteota archaeon]|jgi:hypothetical protein|nr:hypothetical protein [Thermoproteota archaeon]
MSAEGKVLERILSAGFSGIKKSELKKEFATTDINLDGVLDDLAKTGQVFLEKKGTSQYLWGNHAYIEYLRNTDPKFRLIFEAISSLDSNTQARIVTLENTISTTLNDVVKTVGKESPVIYSSTIHLDNFKSEFDTTLGKSRDSLGWTELSEVRNEICAKNNLSSNKFYDLVEQLTNTYHDEYELSTGGTEGIMVRGLLHGFVRGI